MFTMSDVVDLAVRIERNGEQIYREAARAADDPEIERILDWLADEEAEHALWFASLKVPQTALEDTSPLAKMGQAMLEDIMTGRCFSLEHVDFSAVDSIHQVITASLELENDTKMFYELISAFVDSEDVKKRLDLIIMEETGHVRQLTALLRRMEPAVVGSGGEGPPTV